MRSSRTSRKRLAAAASLSVLLVAVLVGTAGADLWSFPGEATDGPVEMIEVYQDGHCHVVPSSCSGATTVTSAWPAGPQPMIILQALLLREASSADVHVPPGAFVLLPAPPPRAA